MKKVIDHIEKKEEQIES